MYFDTSAILSLYVEDAFTEKAEMFYNQHAAEATVSAWVDLEVRSALSFLVRTQRLALGGAQTALTTYEESRLQGVYQSVVLSSEHFAAGVQAVKLEGSLRAGDALHLGAAKVANLPLVTSDKTLYRAANASGVVCFYLSDFSG